MEQKKIFALAEQTVMKRSKSDAERADFLRRANLPPAQDPA